MWYYLLVFLLFRGCSSDRNWAIKFYVPSFRQSHMNGWQYGANIQKEFDQTTNSYIFFIFEVKLSDNVGFRHQIRRQNRILTDFILYIPLIINPCFYHYLRFVLPLWKVRVAIMKALGSEQQAWFCQERLVQSLRKVPGFYEKGATFLWNSLENSEVSPKESGSFP